METDSLYYLCGKCHSGDCVTAAQEEKVIMRRGKEICETLKGIRADIARANDIDYSPTECHHEGDCAGTCPKCESEVRWLEGQLRLRQRLGKAVTIAGLSLAVGAMSSACSCQNEQLDGYMVENDSIECQVDSVEPDLDGDVMPPVENPESESQPEQ